jgi:hypothetical protein
MTTNTPRCQAVFDQIGRFNMSQPDEALKAMNALVALCIALEQEQNGTTTTTVGVVGGPVLAFHGDCNVSFDDELNVWAVSIGEGENEQAIAAIGEDKLLYWIAAGSQVRTLNESK